MGSVGSNNLNLRSVLRFGYSRMTLRDLEGDGSVESSFGSLNIEERTREIGACMMKIHGRLHCTGLTGRINQVE